MNDMFVKAAAWTAVNTRDAVNAVLGNVSAVAPFANNDDLSEFVENGVLKPKSEGSGDGLDEFMKDKIAQGLGALKWVFIVLGFVMIIYSAVRFAMKLLGSQSVRESWAFIATIFIVGAIFAATGTALVLSAASGVAGGFIK